MLVLGDAAFAKVAVPGPLTRLHCTLVTDATVAFGTSGMSSPAVVIVPGFTSGRD